MRRPQRIVVVLAAAVLGMAAACSRGDQKPRLAFVTNNAADFWALAAFGVKTAERECGVETSVHVPPSGTAEEQKRILEDLLAKGVQGIAVSPKDPENMTALLDKVAQRSVLITHDSDAPKSKRLCYIGMDNYDAGRLCGQLVEEAIPQGGAVVILIGNLDQDNARRRRQGVVDQLLRRSHDPDRFDAQDAVLKGDKYEIRATFTDQVDFQKAKAAAQDALTRWRDVACMVGLFEYEVPLILEAVRAANRLSEIRIVGFDEAEATLQGIVDGHIQGTVVQNPFEYGRRSIELLAKLVREPDAARREALLPANRIIDIPARQIRKDNVEAFWADLELKKGKK